MRNVNLEENELTITAIFQQHTKEETIQTLKEALEVMEQEESDPENDEMIEIINICLEMAVVMKVHRFFVDEGFKSVVTVWEGSVYEWIMIVSIHIKALPDRDF